MPNLDNASIAELLIREAEMAEGHRELAYRRPAYSAFMWPVEASEVVDAGLSLTEIVGVGPSISRKILRWFDSSPKAEPPPKRREFLTLAQARKILAKIPSGRSSSRETSKCTHSGAMGKEPSRTWRMGLWRGAINTSVLQITPRGSRSLEAR